MLFISLIGIIIPNFGAKTFNATTDPPSFDLPYLIFPYFSYHANMVPFFTEFQNNTNEDKELATALIDCSTSRTTCSRLQLIPGYLHASFPPHNPQQNIKKFDLKINSSDSFNKIYTKLKNGNVELIETGTIDDLYKNLTFTSEKIEKFNSAFILASLPNQEENEENEEKLRVFTQVALNYINNDALFYYVTSSSIYQKLNIYPNTEIFYLSPTGQPIQFHTKIINEYSDSNEDDDLNNYFSKSNSEISYDELNPFVSQHQVPLFEEPSSKLFEKTHLFVTYVGQSPKNEEIDSLKKIHNHIPIVFVNNSKYPFLSSSICKADFDDKLEYLKNLIKLNNKFKTTSKCIALTNFSSSRSIVLQNLDLSDILQASKDFNNIYLKSTHKIDQFIQKLMAELQFEKELVSAQFVSFLVLWIVLTGISLAIRKKRNQDSVSPITTKQTEKEKEE